MATLRTPQERLDLYLKTKDLIMQGLRPRDACQKTGLSHSTYHGWKVAMEKNGTLEKIGSTEALKSKKNIRNKKPIIQMDLPIREESYQVRQMPDSNSKVALFVGNYSDIKKIYTELFS